MTYLEHLELSKQYREQAMEMLRRANSHEYAFEGKDEFNEYVRLSKLANKHWGIYRMVCTQRHNRNAYRTITVHKEQADL